MGGGGGGVCSSVTLSNEKLNLSLSSHLKNMIAALYTSRTDDGTKAFCRNGVYFGWDTIVRVYESDLYRAQHGIGRQVPGLKYAHVVHDSWTRLNVLPAKIMQVCQWHIVCILWDLLSKVTRWPAKRYFPYNLFC